MNIFLCGQKSFGAEALKLILKLGHRVVCVSSPACHNEKLGHGEDGDRRDALAIEAMRRGLAWHMAGAGRIRASTIPDGVDLIVAAHSHDYISAPMRRKARLGAIGYHPSLLPLHRGRDAVKWAVKMRDRVAGGSVYWFTDQIDAGPIAAQGWCFVRPEDDASGLWRRELFPMGLRLLERVLTDLAAGTMVAVPQDHTLATWEPALDTAPLFRPDLPALGVSMNGVKAVTRVDDMPGPARVAGAEDRDRGFAECRAAMYGVSLD